MDSDADGADWLRLVLGTPDAVDGARAELGGRPFEVRRGVWRESSTLSDAQEQTAEQFGFKWEQRATFDSEASLRRVKTWLLDRYGDVGRADWWSTYGSSPLLLDAGCGAAMSAIALFGDRLKSVRYLGVDVSGAVDVAQERLSEHGLPGQVMQADITALPLEPGTVDVIFSEGVLHHTDSTEGALHALARLLRPGGRILFYVYRRKGPVREFTDDLIRHELRGRPGEDAWRDLLPLTKLGRALGELAVEIDVPEAIDLLGIPAGKIDLQRFFYWHVCKAFYDPDLTLDELNHINFDWFAPANAHRQTIEEVRAWCAAAHLEIERERVEDAGMTIVARRVG